MMMKILLLMILLHILDDFVLQKATLSNLKQREWWEREFGSGKMNDDKDFIYQDDYRMAGLIHALSWSIMIHLPLFIFDFEWYFLAISVVCNCLIHFITDDQKANKKTINLIQDQLIHFGQIGITLLVFALWIV